MSKLGKKLIKAAGEGRDIALAVKYERWSALILDDPEWFISDEINDNEIAGALLLAAKALRSGKVKP